MKLYDYQLEALKKMRKGCVLCGGVGSGKSLTAVGYYYLVNGGSWNTLVGEEYVPMNNPPMDLYIITTARKRDTYEWTKELMPFFITIDGFDKTANTINYNHHVIVDSWNNISKYKDVKDAFFIFDEQRVVGQGVWVKSFLAIAKVNHWILLSATPGDNWNEFAPLFIANGFFKNRSQFNREHVIFSHYTTFPKIERYFGEKKLRQYRDAILVDMDFHRKTIPHHETIKANYDILAYKSLIRDRVHPDTGLPIDNASELCYLLRKCVNSDDSRQKAVLELFESHNRLIIFYSFDYELDILKNLAWPTGTIVREWNGHKHEPLPLGGSWVYLVNYAAGSEGWNCTQTDTIIFYSQHYSYKVMTQAAGRIDRLNTPYTDLYYYHLKSAASIDLAIAQALGQKRNFNESRFVKW